MDSYIITVFFVHCQSYYGYELGSVNVFVYPFYVNAFFFVSGYLLFRKQLNEPIINEKLVSYIHGGGKRLILNLICRIIIPSIIFASIEYIPKNLLRGRNIDISYFLWETLGGLTYWFTSALVVSQIIVLVLLLSRYRKMTFYWVASLPIMAYGMYMVCNNINFLGLSRDLWQFKHGLLAITFVTAGGLYWRFEALIHKWMKVWGLISLIIIYFAILCMFKDNIHILVSTLDLNWIGYLFGCFASILLIEICKYLPEIKLLTYIGQNSISFYFMSGALPIVLSLIMNRINEEASLFSLIVILIASIAIAYCATYIIKRFMPWIFDIRELISTPWTDLLPNGNLSK